MLSRSLSMMRFAIACLLALAGAAAKADSINTQRALRNIEIALNLTIPEAMRSGEIPRGKEFEAKVLSKDLAERVPRARGMFERIEDADKASPAVVAMGKRIDEADQLREALGAAVGAQTASSEEAKARHFAFMKELRVHESTIVRFGELTKQHDRDITGNGSPESFKKSIDELAVVNEACTTRYAGIQNHPTYSLHMLAQSPGDWCKIAAARETYAHRAVVNRVQTIAAHRMKELKEVATNPEKNDGYLTNWIVGALSDPDEVKKQLTEEARPWFAIVGKEIPGGFFGPVDTLVQEAVAAIDRTAPKWTYPDDRFHDARIEGVVHAQMAAGVRVLRTSMLSEGWTITKNGLGIVIDRYRGGHVLFKMPKLTWCSLREFTYVEQANNAGGFLPASAATTSESVRFQACK